MEPGYVFPIPGPAFLEAVYHGLRGRGISREMGRTLIAGVVRAVSLHYDNVEVIRPGPGEDNVYIVLHDSPPVVVREGRQFLRSEHRDQGVQVGRAGDRAPGTRSCAVQAVPEYRHSSCDARPLRRPSRVASTQTPSGGFTTALVPLESGRPDVNIVRVVSPTRRPARPLSPPPQLRRPKGPEPAVAASSAVTPPREAGSSKPPALGRGAVLLRRPKPDNIPPADSPWPRRLSPRRSDGPTRSVREVRVPPPASSTASAGGAGGLLREERATGVCANCLAPGHGCRSCPEEPMRAFCGGCGRQGTTRKKCPSCRQRYAVP